MVKRGHVDFSYIAASDFINKLKPPNLLINELRFSKPKIPIDAAAGAERTFPGQQSSTNATCY